MKKLTIHSLDTKTMLIRAASPLLVAYNMLPVYPDRTVDRCCLSLLAEGRAWSSSALLCFFSVSANVFCAFDNFTCNFSLHPPMWSSYFMASLSFWFPLSSITCAYYLH